MEFSNSEVFNFEGAFRGMRNPMNSWDKSDSVFGVMPLDNLIGEISGLVYNDELNKVDEEKFEEYCDKATIKYYDYDEVAEIALIGPNDMKLAHMLINGGSEHCKFLRQIMVSVDITAPIFYWSEFDTYKIGTTANSCSTMHKLHSEDITINSFEQSGLESKYLENKLIPYLKELQKKYNETKDIKFFREMKCILPSSWLQKRTWTANYEVLRNMIHQRKNHRLREWNEDFIDWCKSLPYAEELLFYKND